MLQIYSILFVFALSCEIHMQEKEIKVKGKKWASMLVENIIMERLIYLLQRLDSNSIHEPNGSTVNDDSLHRSSST